MSKATKRIVNDSALRKQHNLLGAMNGSPYTGASDKRSMLDWITSSGNADAELQSLPTLRNRSRDLFRNTAAAKGAISKLVSGVIGKGLRLQVSIDRDFLNLTEEQAQAWQAKVQQEFRIWSESKDCDFARQLNFFGLQRLTYLSKLTSGDVFILLPQKERAMAPYDLRIQLIEADRVCNPGDLPDTAEIAAGIERDDDGLPVAIHIRTPHPGAALFGVANIKPTWQRIAFYGNRTGRRNVIHLSDINRIGQSRGIPVLTPVIDMLKQVSRYSDAELAAAVVNGMLSVYIKRPLEDSLFGGGSEYDEDGNLLEQPWKDPQNYRLGNGTWIEGAPGQELQMINAQRPSNQFDPFFLACMKQIGMALEIPFEVLVGHFAASYSASRAAMLEFFETVTIYRNDFVDSFCQPIYNEFLVEAVSKGRISAPGFLTDPNVQLAYSGAYWIGSGLKQLDEIKETTAAALRVEKGFSTISQEASTLTGQDYRDIIRQRAEEKRIAKENNMENEYNFAYHGNDIMSQDRWANRGNNER